MKTYKIVYKRDNGLYSADYVEAENIRQVLIQFVAEIGLGAHLDVGDTFRVREVSQEELDKRRRKR